MKKTLILFLLAAATIVGAKELKVLAIGNSFSLSVLQCLPKIVEDSGKHKLKFATTYIGGCPIERHLANLDMEKTKPNVKQLINAEKNLDRETLILQAIENTEKITVKYDDEPYL